MTDVPIVELDPGRQAEARRYSAEARRWMLADLALTALLLILFLVSGASAQLADWARSVSGGNPWLTITLYGAVLFAGYLALSFPITYESSFRLPHRYGMSNQSLSDWLSDQIKSWGVTLIIGGLVVHAIYIFLRWQPEWWWLLAALFMLLFSVLITQLAPVLVLPLFYKLVPLEDDVLRARLKRLGEQAGAHVTGVYTINLSAKSPAANALVMGLGKTRRIALGDTLYRDFTHDEIEMIFAHELGHHVNNDLPKLIAVQGVLTLGGLWLAHQILLWGVERFGFAGVADIGAFPLFLLAMSLFFLLTMPLSNGFSRWRERLADRYALQATGNATAMVSVMTRLANQNLADVDPPRWVTFLLHSHPPLRERIEMAKQFLFDRSNPQERQVV
jgi:STE24 endopeptidase